MASKEPIKTLAFCTSEGPPDPEGSSAAGSAEVVHSHISAENSAEIFDKSQFQLRVSTDYSYNDPLLYVHCRL